MPETASLLNGAAEIAGGGTLRLPAIELRLRVLAGRRLDRASLSLKAAGDTPCELDGVKVIADTGAKLPTDKGVHWVAASWPADMALVGVHVVLKGNAKGNGRMGARLKVLSAGNWLPLTPIDVIALDAAQSFPPVAARQVTAELLVENTIDGKPTGVLVPGEVAVQEMSVTVTEQPCHVAVAIGDDPPFFTYPGPLPVVPVQIDGLTRAANRFLVDHPEATEVPLRISAAGPAKASLVIESFEASLQPEQPASSPQPEPGAPDSAEANAQLGPGEQIWGGTAAGTTAATSGQWCSPTHAVAQAFAPLPPGKALSSLRVRLRAICLPCAGAIAIHPDAHDGPADTPLANVVAEFALGAASADASPAWMVCRLPKPLPLANAPWWAVCRVASGEAVWIANAKAPAEAGPTLHQVGGGPWLAAPARGKEGWLQTEVRIVDRPPTRI